MIVEITRMYGENSFICYPRDLNGAIKCALIAHTCVECCKKHYLIYYHHPDYYITMECGGIYRLRALKP